MTELLDRLSDEDPEARDRATEELLTWGSMIREILEERRGRESDVEAKGRLTMLLGRLPRHLPPWQAELRELTLLVGEDPVEQERCRDRLAMDLGSGACPVSGRAYLRGGRGEAAVAICEDEAHGDVVLILRKFTSVDAVRRGGPEHRRALEETRR